MSDVNAGLKRLNAMPVSEAASVLHGITSKKARISREAVNCNALFGGTLFSFTDCGILPCLGVLVRLVV